MRISSPKIAAISMMAIVACCNIRGSTAFTTKFSSSSTTTTITPTTSRRTFIGRRNNNKNKDLQMSTEISSSSSSSTTSTISEDFITARDGVINNILESGKVPPAMVQTLSHFVSEYAQACYDNGSVSVSEFTNNIATCTKLGVENGLPGPNQYKFTNSSHKAIREPFDYYKFGCDFFRPAMDLEKSVVLGIDNFNKAFDYVEKGENVVFLANHQSEADPQVFSILLEKIGREREGSDIIYVAGHKVTTDPLAIPFSMGRNLLCIHSKKHINVDPTTRDAKTKQNIMSMNAMSKMMKDGNGVAIWVAPSGGRDRRDLDTCEVPVAPFDQKTIDMFRLMGSKSKVDTHFFPLAMVSYELCPPPDTVDAGVGEKRNLRFTPIGIACGDEVPNVGGKESRRAFAKTAEEVCVTDYFQTLAAIDDLVGGDRAAGSDDDSDDDSD